MSKNEAVEQIRSENKLRSEQELVTVFLKNSLQLYAQHKNSEHMGFSKNEEVKADTKNELISLLDGLKDDASNLDSNKIDTLVNTIKSNIDSYIDKVDSELVRLRDELLLKQGIEKPDSIELDEALKQAAENSHFSEIVKQLEDPAKGTRWEQVANFFQKMNMTKLANFFRQKDKEAGYFLGYTFKAAKQGGTHTPDPKDVGGVYTKESDTFLIKRDAAKPDNDIAEYIASQIFKEICPNSSPDVVLIKDGKDDKTYLASKYMANYTDLYKAIDQTQNTRSGFMEFLRNIFGHNKTKTALESKQSDVYQYKNAEKIIASSLFLGDFSVHSGNMGVVNKNQLVRIDFGAAMRQETFGEDVNPYQKVSNPIGISKNYIARDFPGKRLVSEEFAEQLSAISQADLNQTMDNAFENIKQYYSQDAIQKFGQRVGASHDASIDDIQKLCKARIKQRQVSCQQLAAEIHYKQAEKSLAPDNPDALGGRFSEIDRKTLCEAGKFFILSPQEQSAAKGTLNMPNVSIRNSSQSSSRSSSSKSFF